MIKIVLSKPLPSEEYIKLAEKLKDSCYLWSNSNDKKENEK